MDFLWRPSNEKIPGDLAMGMFHAKSEASGFGNCLYARINRVDVWSVADQPADEGIYQPRYDQLGLYPRGSGWPHFCTWADHGDSTLTRNFAGISNRIPFSFVYTKGLTENSIIMKQLLLIIGLCFALIGGANAQIITDKGNKSDQINIKLHEADLLLQLLPLLLTKEQIVNDVLPVVEVARGMQKKQLQIEDEALASLEPIVDAALNDAYTKGAYPSKKMIEEVAKTTKNMSNQRLIVQLKMVSVLTTMLQKTLNIGQKRALINSFDPKFIDPSAKPESLSEEAKMNFFVKRVFMDSMAYDVLKKLAGK
jgi:hypothetical protein